MVPHGVHASGLLAHLKGEANGLYALVPAAPSMRMQGALL